jgi:hypothetical protein
MKLLLLVIALLIPFVGLAQTVSLGLKAGISVPQAFETANFDSGPGFLRTQITYTSRAKRYTIGPAVEVSLPLGLALEFDALYKRLDYNFSSGVRNPFSTFHQEQHNIVSRWDLPLLLKYRVRTFGSLTPNVSAGLNTNYIVNTTQLSRDFFTPSSGQTVTPGPPVKSRNPPAELRYRSAEGLVIAGGLEFRVHGLRATPEFRYTRWAHENFHELSPAGKLRSNLNQAEVLVTLSL